MNNLSSEIQTYENNSPERDAKKIEKDFIEKSDTEVGLLAINLARPDGFAKSLVCGVLATSEELQKKIGNNFVRTHRGYYMSTSPSHSSGANNYLSFQVGVAQRLYAETKTIINGQWNKGLGLVLPAETFLERKNVVVRWGNLGLKTISERIKQNGVDTGIATKISSLDKDSLRHYENHPPLEDLYDLVQLVRKEKMLDENKEQAEVSLDPTDGNLPRVSLSETAILIPDSSKEAIKRLVEIKIKESLPFTEKIIDAFGIDLRHTTADEVLGQYQNIYWYPQENIGLAIKYLTTHPDLVKKLVKTN